MRGLRGLGVAMVFFGVTALILGFIALFFPVAQRFLGFVVEYERPYEGLG